MNPSLSSQLKGGIAALVLFLGLAWFTDLDLTLARMAWSAAEPHWAGQSLQPWKFLYDFGQPPALFAGLAGLLVFLASFTNPGLKSWRGPGLYLFVVLALGPGLLVNTLGKGLSGRPRPMELLEFGGAWEFRRPLDLGIPGRGRSFLSGHASMAFYWFTLAFLFKGAKSRLAFWAVLAFGSLMGAARVLQGGHFFSDVALCGAAIYLICAAASPLIHWQPRASFFSLPGIRPALLAFSASWLLLSHPVYEERNYLFHAEGSPPPAAGPTDRLYAHAALKPASANLSLSLERGDIWVDFRGEEAGIPGALPLGLKERFQGLTLGWGKALLHTRPFERSAGWPLQAGDLSFGFEQELKGLFWSDGGGFSVSLPRQLLAEARLKSAKGSIRISPLPEGRRVVVYGALPSSRMPAGFSPHGAKGHLREGADPLLVLVLEAPEIVFE